jgi:hypothetical protein
MISIKTQQEWLVLGTTAPRSGCTCRNQPQSRRASAVKWMSADQSPVGWE